MKTGWVQPNEITTKSWAPAKAQINKTNARYSGKPHILDENPYLIQLLNERLFSFNSRMVFSES
jgi:hypothetical protein